MKLKKLSRSISLFAGVLFLLNACAHSGPVVVTQPTGLQPAAFWKDQEKRSGEVRQISAKVSLRYEGEKRSVAGKGRLLADLPGKLRLELRDVLGRVQFLLVMAPEGLTAFYPMQRMAYLDDASGSGYLRRTMGMDVSFADVESLLVGLLPHDFKKATLSGWAWDAERGQYKAKLTSASATSPAATLYVDPVSAAIRSLDIQTKNESIEVNYSDFDTCCGEAKSTANVPFGQLVKIKLARSKNGIEFGWDDVQRSESKRMTEAFNFVLPEHTEKILLK